MKRIASFCFMGALSVLLFGVVAPAAEPEYGFGGGGPSIGLFMPDLSETNEFITGIGFASLDGSLFLIGGSGRGGLLPGPVGGGAGWGAWIESRQGNLHAEYGVGLGGLDVGYALGGDDSSALVVGMVLGAGGAELILTELPLFESLAVGPHGIIVEPTQETYDSLFAFAAPYVDAQIQLVDWIGLGIRAGYLWAPFEFNWSDTGELDPPRLAISGFYVRFSVIFGGFGKINVDPVDELPTDAP